MERRISLVILILIFSGIFLFPAVSQELAQQNHIQLMLWADIDAYPEFAEAEKRAHPSDTVFGYPERRLKELAPFLITGMVHGWSFSYTPSDTLRNVPEYFNFSDIQPLGDSSAEILYKTPWVEQNRLYCWVEFTRSESMLRYLQFWESVIHPKIHGIGKGNLLDGFDGIKDACGEALKNAVREYYRQQIRNKPKEITGKVLIRGEPKLGMTSGRYVVELDFFLETGTIIKYTQF